MTTDDPSTTPLALVFTGGDEPLGHIVTSLPRPKVVIAADAGWGHARAHGFTPHFLVGDFDSITPGEIDEAERLGTEIVQHPVDKDVTDTEIAVSVARNLQYRRIHVVSGGGDRFDHLVGLLHSLVAHADEVTMTAHVGSAHVRFVTPAKRLHVACSPGTTVSLIPLGGGARGVTTAGLKWDLRRGRLEPFASRGVSNLAMSDSFEVSLRTGVIAVITTDTQGAHQ